MGDGLRYTIALVWVPGTHNVSVVGSGSLWLCSQLSAQEKDLPGGTCCLPYHRALGSLFSSENCVGVMSKSGCQLTVLYYKDVEVFEICAVFHGKSRGREEMNGEEERRINPRTWLSLNSVSLQVWAFLCPLLNSMDQHVVFLPKSFLFPFPQKSGMLWSHCLSSEHE